MRAVIITGSFSVKVLREVFLGNVPLPKGYSILRGIGDLSERAADMVKSTFGAYSEDRLFDGLNSRSGYTGEVLLSEMSSMNAGNLVVVANEEKHRQIIASIKKLGLVSSMTLNNESYCISVVDFSKKTLEQIPYMLKRV